VVDLAFDPGAVAVAQVFSVPSHPSDVRPTRLVPSMTTRSLLVSIQDLPKSTIV
jgi:hypothetical protein